MYMGRSVFISRPNSVISVRLTVVVKREWSIML